MQLNNTINNINFGSVWRVKQSKFTKSQNRLADDIELKLAKYSKKRDFVIEPLHNDVVELSELYNHERNEKYVQYNNPKVIDKYSNNQPFEIEDFEKVKGASRGDLLATFLFAGLDFASFISLAVPADRAKAKRQAKKVATVVKDSLQPLKQETLRLTKDSLSMFK